MRRVLGIRGIRNGGEGPPCVRAGLGVQHGLPWWVQGLVQFCPSSGQHWPGCMLLPSWLHRTFEEVALCRWGRFGYKLCPSGWFPIFPCQCLPGFGGRLECGWGSGWVGKMAQCFGRYVWRLSL